MIRYSFPKLFVLACTSLLLVLAGCDQSALKEESTSAEETPTPTKQEKELNAALDAMARDVAAALENESVRTLIKKETGKLLAGEPNVLFQTIASKKVKGLSKDGEPMTFEEVLAGQRASLAKKGKALSRSEAVEQVRQDAATIPKFDIGVPVHLEKWDPKTTTPLVAFHHRQEIDDTKLERLKAYDAQGNVHWLDAFEKPEQPVVDVGINERTTTDGKVRPAYAENKALSAPCLYAKCGGGGGYGGGGDSSSDSREWGNREYLKRIYLHDDEDIDYGPDLFGGWRENSPEVRLRVRSIEATGTDEYSSGYNEFSGSISGVGGDDSWYDVNESLFDWKKDVGNATAWFFFDHDGDDDDDARTISPQEYSDTYTFDRGYNEDSDNLGWDVVEYEDDPSSITYYIDDGKFDVSSSSN